MGQPLSGERQTPTKSEGVNRRIIVKKTERGSYTDVSSFRKRNGCFCHRSSQLRKHVERKICAGSGQRAPAKPSGAAGSNRQFSKIWQMPASMYMSVFVRGRIGEHCWPELMAGFQFQSPGGLNSLLSLPTMALAPANTDPLRKRATNRRRV